MYAEDASVFFLVGSTSTHWLSMEVNSAASECLFEEKHGLQRHAASKGYLNYYFMIASWRFYNFSWETFSFFHHQHFPVSWRLERAYQNLTSQRAPHDTLLRLGACPTMTMDAPRPSFHVVPCRSMSFRRYLMGEFGHLLPPSVTPRAKFEALHRHFVRGSQQTKATRARARALFRAACWPFGAMGSSADLTLTLPWPKTPQIMDRAQLGDHRPSPGGDHSAGIREAPERKWSFVRGSRQLPEGNSGADHKLWQRNFRKVRKFRVTD